MATTYINPFVFAGEELGGMVLLTPSSIAYTGTSASIGANGSVTFTAVSSLSLNGVFSADYDNYMIVCQNLRGGTAVDIIYARLRASGTDNSTAGSYTYQYLYASSTTVGAARVSATEGIWYASGGVQRSGFTSYLYGPYLAQPTAIRSVGASGQNNAYIEDEAFTHNQSTAYDGFSMFMGAGTTLTGLVSVFGLVGA